MMRSKEAKQASVYECLTPPLITCLSLFFLADEQTDPGEASGQRKPRR